MNNQQQIKSLTWKYFWQQKFKEVSKLFSILFIIVMIPFLLGHFIGDNQSTICGGSAIVVEDCNNIQQWIEGFSYFLLGIFIGYFIVYLLLFQVFLLIRDAFLWWIESNWDEATSKAKKEINKT